jgi:hypothetical protein
MTTVSDARAVTTVRLLQVGRVEGTLQTPHLGSLPLSKGTGEIASES